MNYELMNYEVFGMECGIICSRDINTDESRCSTAVGLVLKCGYGKEGNIISLIDKISMK